ncbi:MAG: hypothetical protein E4H44_03010 [Candidatus Aminicenantes bacterium]|nr:MAG: hypothetical protein E4H44_03010 [Candidatus Aminicenantes bacterium]
MEKARTLLTFHDLKVEVETSPGDELIAHMHSTVLGQPGSFRYRHMDLVDRMVAPGENYFMYLRKRGKMLGSVGFMGRHTRTGGVDHDSWLIRFFSIKAPMGSFPSKRKEKQDVKDESKRASVLGKFIQPVMANPSQLRGENQDAGAPAIVYGLIDQKNLRSVNFSIQMGMETVGEVVNFSFSRLRPKRSERVEPLAESDREAMRGLLHKFYRDYILFFDDPLFKDNGYHVIKESGRVVAGLQVYPVRWHVVDFGSGMVNKLVGLLAKIPWIKKRINPEELKLLAFDGIYCEPGYEAVLYELMEGVLELTGRYLAILMMDGSSALYTIFRERQKLGILHRMLGSFTADVRVRFINMPEEVRQLFLDQPTYIPTYDNS